jgi:hypothetical protein
MRDRTVPLLQRLDAADKHARLTEHRPAPIPAQVHVTLKIEGGISGDQTLIGPARLSYAQ